MIFILLFYGMNNHFYKNRHDSFVHLRSSRDRSEGDRRVERQETTKSREVRQNYVAMDKNP